MSFAQLSDNTGECNAQNIYYQSLVQYYLANHPDKNSVTDTLYLEEDSVITDNILLSYPGVQFIRLNQSEIDSKAKADTNFSILKLYPLEYHKGLFYIGIKEIWIRNSKENKDKEYIALRYVKLEFKFKHKHFLYKRTLICRA